MKSCAKDLPSKIRCSSRVDMLSVGSFATAFAGPPVKKEEPKEPEYA